jgi:hypothetical protein
MAEVQYGVAYVVRSPANTKQEDFAVQVEEVCNSWSAGGWRLVNAVGDYGARVTLGMWLCFVKEE